MIEPMLTTTFMWNVFAVYVIAIIVYLFILKLDVANIFLSALIAIPFFIYGPDIENHYIQKEIKAQTVVKSESAGTVLDKQNSQGQTSGISRITAIETELAVYRVFGDHTVRKGESLELQTRANEDKYLCYTKEEKKCMRLAESQT